MLGYIDALLASVITGSIPRKQHNSDKELIGQGVGNVMSGSSVAYLAQVLLLGTVVSILAGVQTALSGLVRASCYDLPVWLR